MMEIVIIYFSIQSTLDNINTFNINLSITLTPYLFARHLWLGSYESSVTRLYDSLKIGQVQK